MHHKYVVRDREAVWTGSTNWTEDSWSREENVIAIVESASSRTPSRSTSSSSGHRRTVEGTGRVEPRPVDVGGITCGRGSAGARRGARAPDREAIGQARERVRIASPVITSGPILGTLAEVGSDGKVDVAGVVDDTQVDGVLFQWS